MSSSAALIRVLLAGLAGLALTLLALQRPAPLFVNFGTGDDPFARGFRSGWERDGTDGSGETTFHWTKDGSRIELPLRVLSGEPRARLRLARFIDTPAQTTVWAHGRVLHRVTHSPGGWSEVSWPLPGLRGPMSLLLRVEPEEGEKLGVALDWMEVHGVARLWPRARLFAQLALLFLGGPLLGFVLHGHRAAWAGAVGLAVLGPLVVLVDRFGGIVSLGHSALPFLIVTALLALVAFALAHLGADAGPARPLGLVIAVLALVALFHPFFYYPDVDTHARFTDAIYRDPKVAWDPTPFQMRFRAWTRGVGDKTVAFPYSPAFHLLALPLRPLVGSVGAVKTLAVAAVATSLLSVFVLAAVLGLPVAARLVAAALFAALPVISSRLTLALYPALLAQALELLLALFLIRWCARAKPALALLVAALVVAQVAYTGALFTVGTAIALLGVASLMAGEKAVARRLWVGQLIAAAAVIALLYARFVPVLLRDVLPAGSAATEGTALGRLFIFYGVVHPALVLLGLFALREAPIVARRVALSFLAAGASLLFLRYTIPGLLRDVKDVELLAGPVAVISAAALASLWRQGKLARGVACLAGLLLLLRGAHAAAAAYAERFVAIGR